jgi:hypothetical protein
MKGHLGYLLGFAAIALASCAAFFSIYGLSQLFAGASLAVIVMASTLEFSKLIIASYLHSYWGKITKIMKIYLSIGVVTLVLITSAGIYGFLSNAFQKTANSLEIFDGEVLNHQTKVDQYTTNVEMNQKTIDLKFKRVNQLTDIRVNQEARLDERNSYANRLQITNSNNEVEKLNKEIDLLSTENATLGDSISKYKGLIIGLKNTNISAGEVGPLKYMSELTGAPMNEIVNYFILLLVFVFDPLAICLLIATISVFKINSNTPLNEVHMSEEVEDSEEDNEEVENDEQIEASEPKDTKVEVSNTEPLKVERPPIKREDIKEIKQMMNRGFSTNIPKNHVIFDKNGRKQ